ncbi:MAG: BPSL0067 family protein [Azoarcus sp.]|jgi:hypothetical protein|nr:BPSL0067 family protein [Azoarcus sp.]
MPFVANLKECETLAAKNIWVNKAPDVNSKECVAAVKAMTGLLGVGTSRWRRGKKVKSNSISPGTAIATFPIEVEDRERFRFKGHAAIFVRHAATGIIVYDQWDNKRFSTRLINYRCSGHVSDDGEAFFVIELAEVLSSEPALCSLSSCYSELTCGR